MKTNLLFLIEKNITSYCVSNSGSNGIWCSFTRSKKMYTGGVVLGSIMRTRSINNDIQNGDCELHIYFKLIRSYSNKY